MYLALKFLLMVLFFMNHHHVDCGSKVKYLPGFEGPLPFELETGYIGVGEKEEQQMFYYFIKSESNPKEDPLLLWLSGGPGCSSLSGLILENGPLTLKFEAYNGSIPSLVSTTYSWTKMANIIFLDQPVGSGFSYSRTPLVDKASDTSEVKNIHEFLQKWLSKHPQFYSNPFYGAGDSYAGMIIPALVHEISKGNYICCEPPINLQGYMLGNPKTNKTFENSFRVPYAHGMALISDELYESMKKNCKGNYVNVDSLTKECLKLIEDFQMCTNKIKIYHILTPDCNITFPDCYYHYYFRFDKWANEESVREALHVKKGSIDIWFQCNKKLQRGEGYIKDIKSSIPYHILNSINDYKSLIYSGDHDMAVPFLSTQAWIKSLNYSIIDDWRPWLINDQIAGYTRNYANKMTFATVKGSGHTIEYKPNEGFIMFQRWISGNPL